MDSQSPVTYRGDEAVAIRETQTQNPAHFVQMSRFPTARGPPRLFPDDVSVVTPLDQDTSDPGTVDEILIEVLVDEIHRGDFRVYLFREDDVVNPELILPYDRGQLRFSPSYQNPFVSPEETATAHEQRWDRHHVILPPMHPGIALRYPDAHVTIGNGGDTRQYEDGPYRHIRPYDTIHLDNHSFKGYAGCIVLKFVIDDVFPQGGPVLVPPPMPAFQAGVILDSSEWLDTLRITIATPGRGRKALGLNIRLILGQQQGPEEKGLGMVRPLLYDIEDIRRLKTEADGGTESGRIWPVGYLVTLKPLMMPTVEECLTGGAETHWLPLPDPTTAGAS